jgi:hypothetical protein
MLLVKLPFKIYLQGIEWNPELRKILNVCNVTLNLLTWKD